jgi:hypothetical protein
MANNFQERPEVLTRIWNCPMVRILCCSCYEKGLSEYTPEQLEIKCFIEGRIGRFKYMLYFGKLNTQNLDEIYSKTIPGRNLHLSIAKRDSKMERFFRGIFQYKSISLENFRILLNKYYKESSFSIISTIITKKEEIYIEVPDKLAPAIFSHSEHEFLGFLAPILVDNAKKSEYENIILSRL